MNALDLLKDCQDHGVSIEPGPGGKLRLSPPGKLPEDIKAKLREHKKEILLILNQQRHFLSRPIGEEHNFDSWEAWQPFMLWLLENEKAHYLEICEAEDELNELERNGIASGEIYDRACNELHKRFEAARKIALQRQVKVWTQ